MRILIGLILLAFPIAELILLVSLGHRYGGWLLLYLVVIGYLGLQLIRTEKQMLSANMMHSMELGANPFKAMLGSARNMVAGVLLLIPGVISDVIAAILLLIPVRQAKMPNGDANTYQTEKNTGSTRQNAANDDIIEGEYTEIKEPSNSPFASSQPPDREK